MTSAVTLVSLRTTRPSYWPTRPRSSALLRPRRTSTCTCWARESTPSWAIGSTTSMATVLLPRLTIGLVLHDFADHIQRRIDVGLVHESKVSDAHSRLGRGTLPN